MQIFVDCLFLEDVFFADIILRKLLTINLWILIFECEGVFLANVNDCKRDAQEDGDYNRNNNLFDASLLLSEETILPNDVSRLGGRLYLYFLPNKVPVFLIRVLLDRPIVFQGSIEAFLSLKCGKD